MMDAGKIVLLFCTLSCLFQPLLTAEELPSENHDHHHHVNEVGFSLGYVYLDQADVSAVDLHLHYMRRLEGEGFLRHFGVGCGFETIFTEQLHYNPMLSLALFPYRNLAVIVSPGVVFEKHLGEYEARYSTHLEVAYGFIIKGYEVGPVLGFAHSEEGRHYSLAIHFSKGF